MRSCPKNLHELVKRVQVGTSNSDFDKLFRAGLFTHPIPFFGDVSTAKVITVGINPSADEFVENEWPKQQMTADQLGVRCREYFLDGSRHTWFTEWEKALLHLRVSYRNGSAAHIAPGFRLRASLRRGAHGYNPEWTSGTARLEG